LNEHVKATQQNFPFFLDLDSTPEASILPIIKGFVDLFSENYSAPEEYDVRLNIGNRIQIDQFGPWAAFVAACKSKTVGESLHVHFPFVYVTKDIARSIFNKFKARHPDLANYVDAEATLRGTLRMIYCDKWNASTHEPEGRRLRPKWIVYNDQTVDIEEPELALFDYFSIKNSGTTLKLFTRGQRSAQRYFVCSFFWSNVNVNPGHI